MSWLLTCSQLGQAGQAGGGEPLDRLGVGLNRLSGLALGGQAQGERADLSLEYPGVQLLWLPRMRSRCGHGHRLSLPWRTIRTQRYRRQQTAKRKAPAGQSPARAHRGPHSGTSPACRRARPRVTALPSPRSPTALHCAIRTGFLCRPPLTRCAFPASAHPPGVYRSWRRVRPDGCPYAPPTS